MGVSTRAMIDGSKWSLEDVLAYIGSIEGVSVESEVETSIAGYQLFVINVNGEKRRLNFHNRLGHFGSDLYTMGFNEFYDTLQRVAERFGGMYQERDDVELWEACGIDYEHDGMSFIMKWAFSKGIIDDFSLESCRIADEAWSGFVSRP